jgi:protein tyrosine phosphatase (PTP) superfamily phosphohydrolase (DUF442 family)
VHPAPGAVRSVLLPLILLLITACADPAPRAPDAAAEVGDPAALPADAGSATTASPSATAGSPGGPTTDATAAASAGGRPARWAAPAGIPGLENAWRVSPVLVRAEQPSAAGLVAAREAGIRTVIDLRAFHDDSAAAEAAGLRFIRVPMNTWHAEDEDVVRVMAALGDAHGAPYLIHCQHGSDRTGTMVAMYRMVWQGWSRADAIDEMVHGGYGFHPVWTNLVHYLQTVDIDAIRAKAQARIAAGQD